MKRDYFVILFATMLLMSCANRSKSKEQIVQDAKHSRNNNANIEGLWRLVDDDFVSMIIKSDSIYYPDQKEASLYKLLNTSLIIYDDKNHRDTIKYEMKGQDTLLFLITDNAQVYVRNAKR